ncbi:hypothetical protein AXG93_3954s1020 [Marchantia polymorpha subsp. ruderalis]|uniref:Uncharacterized protein n=1 Tax=Marchantia polymorpha subsp. ruderalis TaxID=1480154 RepID=A0A176VM61_MARPO|nr:hypothetical protein AXG93_3954s1020 [Marchantia polymorpha subsp. ruderalis]
MYYRSIFVGSAAFVFRVRLRRKAVPSSLGCVFGGRMRLRRKNSPSAEEEKKSKTAEASIFDGNAFGDTGRAAVARDSPSSREDGSAEILGRTDLPSPKARVPLGEALRPSVHRGRRAATARTPTQERCLPSQQVPFDDSPSGQGPSAQERFRVVPSALKTLEHIPTSKGRNAETRVTLAVPRRDDVVGPPGAGSPTPLEVLAGHGVEAAVEEAARPNARESPSISLVTEILETEDDTPSVEEEVQSVRGTPIGVLCEQVVPLPRYLDRKAIKYGDPRQCGSYVELVQNRTRIKVATNPKLMVLDQKYQQLEERYNFLQDKCALSRKLQKTAI